MSNNTVVKTTAPFYSYDGDIRAVDTKLIMVKILTILINLGGLIACASVTAVEKQQGFKTSSSASVPVFFIDEHTGIYSLPARFFSHQVQVWYLYTIAFVFLTVYSLLTFMHVVADSFVERRKARNTSLPTGSWGLFVGLYALAQFGNRNIHFYRIWNNAVVIAIITPAVFITLKLDSIVFNAAAFGVILYAIGGTGVHESIYSWLDTRGPNDTNPDARMTEQERFQQRFAYVNIFIHSIYILTPLILFWCVALSVDFAVVGGYYWTLHTFYFFFLVTYVSPLLVRKWTKKMMWSFTAPNELFGELWISTVVAICFGMTVKIYQNNFLADYGL